MNQDSSRTWHQTFHHDDAMLASNADDFTDFLHLEIDFPGFNESEASQNGLDTPMGDLGIHELAMGVSAEEMSRSMMQTESISSHLGQDDPSRHYSSTAGHPHSVPDVQQREHQRGAQSHDLQKSQYPNRMMVPLTPKSSEMAGSAAEYYPYMGNAAFATAGAYPGYRDDQMSFTPLVSPAVTPIDPMLQLSETTTSAEYFSPLTSPALEAQNIHSRRKKQPSGPIIASETLSSNINAPIHSQTNGRHTRSGGRKPSRKKSVVERSSGRRASYSMATKPDGRWKVAAVESTHPDQLVISAASTRPTTRHGLSSSSDGSGQSSISPEPLSESLMPPPSLPRSAGRSPNLAAYGHSSGLAGEAVTPATLMRLQNQKVSPRLHSMAIGAGFDPGSDFLEDIMLPESAAISGPPSLTLDTSNECIDEETTPTFSAKTPKLSASSTPRTSTSKVQAQSPATSSHKRGGSRSGSANKSRQAGSILHVSPAIRPKISPVIKPLMPSSTPGTPSISADSSAIYLASKSNYQNILDGTHLPGVSYPEALAENLTSKRTSHKLAEQGRRNRMNIALKEMESLLPQVHPVKGKRERSGNGDGDPADKSSASSNSKANTVELAIEYIRVLQAEITATRNKLTASEENLRGTASSVEADTASSNGAER